MPNKRKGAWQPFDALEGYRQKLQETEKQNEAIAKPVLSEDQELRISEMIVRSLYSKCEVNIKYFDNGEIISYHGQIEKIDVETNTLILSPKRMLEIINILEINEKV